MLPFGETVLVWRLTRGLTQAGLAAAAGVSRPNLSAIERGDREVTLRTLRRLALALDVRPGVLADGIAPDAAPAPLARGALERIASAARRRPGPAARTGAPPDLEARLAGLLADAAGARLANGKRRRQRSLPARNAERAYFLLKTATSSATVASLIDRLTGGAGAAGE